MVAALGLGHIWHAWVICRLGSPMGAALLAPLMHASVSMYFLGLLARLYCVKKAWGGHTK